jgi:hypothetical protein
VTKVASPPTDPTVAIAVLYERIGHVIEKVDALAAKIDAQSAHRDLVLQDLEERVEVIEKQISGARGFLTGLAVLGGLLGGSVAAGLGQMLGG